MKFNKDTSVPVEVKELSIRFNESFFLNIEEFFLKSIEYGRSSVIPVTNDIFFCLSVL